MRTLQQLRKRHFELFLLIMVLLLVTVATTIVLASTQGERLLAASLGVLSILCCVYVVQSELTVRSLSQQLLEEAFATLDAQARETILNIKVKELTALHTALNALATEERPEKALDTILASALSLFGAFCGSIMLVDESRERFVIAAAHGLKPEYLEQVQGIGDSVAGKVVTSGQAILINGTADPSRYENFINKETAIRSSLCVPLCLKGTIIGVLNCSSVGANGRTFTECDLELMRLFAQYASLVLGRAQSATTHRVAV